MFPLRFPCLQVDWMSDMFDGLLLQADDASDAGSVDNDSDLEVVEAEVNVVQPEEPQEEAHLCHTQMMIFVMI